MSESLKSDNMMMRAPDKGGSGGGKESEDNRTPKEKAEEIVLNTFFSNWSKTEDFNAFLNELYPVLKELKQSDEDSLHKLIENLVDQFIEEIDISQLDDAGKKAVKIFFKSRFVRNFASEDTRDSLLAKLDGRNIDPPQPPVPPETAAGDGNDGNQQPPDNGGVDTEGNHEDEPDDWIKEFNKKWEILNDHYRDDLISSPDLIDLMNELNDIVEAHFSEEEKQVYKRTLLMRDTATEFSGPFRHLVLKDIEGAHKKAYHNEASELRDYMNLETEIFGVSIKEVVSFLEEDVFENWTHTKRDGTTFNWSYAANGDPEDENQKDKIDKDGNHVKGALTLKDLIRDKFPALESAPDFLLDSFRFFVIVSELRYKKFYPYYNYYQNSPINGMNAAAILPWGIPGYLTYKAASITKIPGYKSVLLLTKYPKRSGAFPEGGIDVSFDKNWANGRFSGRGNEEFVENRSRTFVLDHFGTSDSKEDRFNGALEKRKDMMMVRNVLKWKFSPDVDFGSVELKPDMQVLPSTWDVVKGEWRGKKINVSLDDLFEVYQQFDSFAKTVDDVPKLENPLQAFSLLADLITNTSRFKMIFNKLSNPVFNDFKELVNLMYMFYLKQLFDQYVVLDKVPGLANKFKPKHVLFAEGIKDEVKDDKTLPSHILNFIIQSMDQVKVVPTSKWGLIFYPQTLDNDTPIFLRIQKFIGTKFSAKVDRWLKPASPSDENPNK